MYRLTLASWLRQAAEHMRSTPDALMVAFMWAHAELLVSSFAVVLDSSRHAASGASAAAVTRAWTSVQRRCR